MCAGVYVTRVTHVAHVCVYMEHMWDICNIYVSVYVPYMCVQFYFFKKNQFIFYHESVLFIYFWLHWVFVAVCGLSLVALSGDYSSLWCTGLLLQWLLVAEHGLYPCGLQ